jgi:4-hydroxy-tetrahydrodipicolinate synthase
MNHQLLDASAKGVYTISATPFTDAGDIDWPSVDSLVEFYLQCGVQGLTVLGMMGEAQKLSDQESAEFTRHFLRRVNGRVPVIVGVSNSGTSNLVKLSKIAMDAGADAHPSVVMFKHEDCPGLKKLTQIRKACDGVTRRYISILVGNGGLYVPQELARGADGIMTGFA